MSKEATVFLVDLGKSMGEKRHGREQTDLEWAMEYVWDKITSIMGTGRKSAIMSVIGFRTSGTDLGGVLEENEGYENITVFSDLKQWTMEDIRTIQPILEPSSTNSGDLMSGVAVAIQQIDKATRGVKGNPLKFIRRLIIVTDGKGLMDADDIDLISSKVKEYDPPIDVVVLGADFDDEEGYFKEEDKPAPKRENEEALAQFASECGGTYGTLAEAVEQLAIPRLKETRPTPSYKGTLTLGDTENYDSTITIDVERYPCTMVAKPPTASSFVVRTDLGGVAGSSAQSSLTIPGDNQNGSAQLSAVRNQRVYQTEDPKCPGQKISVEEEDMERGYEYGRTAVHISESEANIVKLETQQSLQIVGFIPSEKFDRYLPMSRTNYLVPQKTNKQAQLALSSFVHALYESECYAVARFVAKENKAPLMIVLVPHIRPDYEALVESELPFEEDMRRYKFPSLDKKLTVSGRTVTEHRDIPDSALTEAMSNYVDAMDLSGFGRDEDGAPTEYAKIEDTYSPLLHRVNNVIRWRATHPDPKLPIPKPHETLTKFSEPPPALLEEAKSQLAALVGAANVKKVPPKVRGRGKRSRADREKPLSGLDVDALLGNPKRVKIDASNLIPSFKQALAATDDLDAIQEAADAMAEQICALIRTSLGDSAYGRALEALRVMRDELIELEEPDMWNAFIRGLKKEILGSTLGGDRREFWLWIKNNGCGLIDQKTCHASDVGEDEAAEFYKKYL